MKRKEERSVALEGKRKRGKRNEERKKRLEKREREGEKKI